MRLISLGIFWLLLYGGALDGGESVAVGVGELAPISSREGGRAELVYYVWDAGDGRLIPTARGFAEAAAPSPVVWHRPGEYDVAWEAVGLSGWSSGMRKAGRVTVLGGEAIPPELELQGVAAWTPEGNVPVERSSSGVFFWNGADVDREFEESGLILDLDGLRSMGWLVLSPPRDHSAPGVAEGRRFPGHFLVESALTPQGPWYPVPGADFPFFPNPGERDVWIPLRGLLAGALRVVVPRAGESATVPGEYGWTLAEARVLEGPGPWFLPPDGFPRDWAAWNNLYHVFGIADNEVHQRFNPWWETDRPLDGGMVCIGSCEWLAWGSQKLSWLENPELNRQLESYIAGNPVDDKGVVWAAPGSAKHLGHSVHYVNNAIYPTAVARHYLQRRDRAFLDRKDPKTGESILSKARRAIDYLVEDLGGEAGLVVLEDPETDGTPESHGANYWDFWLFGGRSAYLNAFYYEALSWCAELEEALGEAGRAARFRALRPKTKAAYNEAFWNPDAGRYIGWIDTGGESYDFGFTFVNLHALAFGLADPVRAEFVLSWLDGERLLEGEDATGDDIYHFGFAPRTNTVDARRGNPPPVNTWGGSLSLEPDGSAGYGRQIQNGGAIFHVSYYDLHARNRCRGAADAAKRFHRIAGEFHRDHLRRDPANNEGASDIVGILREFPESGLIPVFFLDGVLGLKPVADGLRIAPSLPPDWPDAGVARYVFAGTTYRIYADRSLRQPVLKGSELRVPAGGSWLLTPGGGVRPEKGTGN